MTKQDITGTFLGKHNLSKTHPTHNEKAFGMAIGMWIETYQNKNRKLLLIFMGLFIRGFSFLTQRK